MIEINLRPDKKTLRSIKKNIRWKRETPEEKVIRDAKEHGVSNDFVRALEFLVEIEDMRCISHNLQREPYNLEIRHKEREYLLENKLNDAVELLDKTKETNKPEDHYLLGDLLFELGEKEEDSVKGKHLFEIAFRHFDITCRNKGGIGESLGKYSSAWVTCREIIETSGNFDKGCHYLERKNYAMAAFCFEKAAELRLDHLYSRKLELSTEDKIDYARALVESAMRNEKNPKQRFERVEQADYILFLLKEENHDDADIKTRMARYERIINSIKYPNAKDTKDEKDEELWKLTTELKEEQKKYSELKAERDKLTIDLKESRAKEEQKDTEYGDILKATRAERDSLSKALAERDETIKDYQDKSQAAEKITELEMERYALKTQMDLKDQLLKQLMEEEKKWKIEVLRGYITEILAKNEGYFSVSSDYKRFNLANSLANYAIAVRNKGITPEREDFVVNLVKKFLEVGTLKKKPKDNKTLYRKRVHYITEEIKDSMLYGLYTKEFYEK
ncbi:hypothetical protein KY342_06610, partial [Candidatus Woesearchaeota archaeon]|nr:hypothetical protein [Candidatus Woesearchaeota archaeon]